MQTNHYSQPFSYLWFLLLPAFFLLLSGLSGCSDDEPAVVTETSVMTDIEGNVYKTVWIGNQWWMAENLRVKRFRSGEIIPELTNAIAWSESSAPAYCMFNNTDSGLGLLYNWYAVQSTQELAPVGWRIPSDEDWKELEAYLGMTADQLEATNWRGTDEGDMLKEKNTTTTGWIDWPGVWGTDAVGFDAPGGSCRVFNGEWGVPGLRHSGYWWSSTAGDECGWFRYLDYKKSGIFRYCAEPTYGFNIRCVKN